jgi:hypothetical protein
VLPNVSKSHEEIQGERNQQLAARFVASWEQAVTLSKVWWWAQNWAQSPSVIFVSRSRWLGPETDPYSTLLPDGRQSRSGSTNDHRRDYREIGTVRRNVAFLATVWTGDFRRYEVSKFFKVSGHQGRPEAHVAAASGAVRRQIVVRNNPNVNPIGSRRIACLAGDYLVGWVGQLEPHLAWTKCEAD